MPSTRHPLAPSIAVRGALSRAAGTLVLALLLAGASAPPVRAQDGTQPIVTSDLLAIKTAGAVDVSADGRRAVYVVTSMGEGEDGELRTFRHLWLADLEGTAPPRQLTHGERSDGSPRFSPDGTRIAFSRSYQDEGQIWILPLDGGEAWPLTAKDRGAPYGAGGARWSPDGSRILFGAEVPTWAITGELPWAEERPGRDFRDAPDWAAIAGAKKAKKAKDGEAAKDSPPEPAARPDGSLAEIRSWLEKNAAAGNPRVLTRQDLQDEHDLASSPTFSHLFVIAVAPDAEAKQLTTGFRDFGNGDWSPDGTRIAASGATYPEHPDRVIDSNLYTLRADGSEVELLLDLPGFLVYGPRWSPDGRSLLFGAADDQALTYGLSQVGVVPAPGAGQTVGGQMSARLLFPGYDFDVDDAQWSADGIAIYFTTSAGGAFPLLRAPVAPGVPGTSAGTSLGTSEAGTIETIVGGPRGVGSYDVAGGRLVFSATAIENPNELYTAAADGSGERRLSALNSGWLAEKRVVRPTEHWVERPDGARVQYWVMPPAAPRPGVRYPVVLEMHGGPSAMWGPGEFTMWHELQLLASWGYGIVYANPRGSSGYGFDFKHANFKDWGTSPAGDVLAALDAALAGAPWADPEQLFLTGGSYAGYLTAWIVGHDHRFDAAVAQRGVYDLGYFFGEGNAWRLVPYQFGGYPWEPAVREVLQANSPLTFVDEIRTPLLIIHSDNDLRTGITQSETLFKSLKVLGAPVEYVRYPDEGHDLSRTGNPKRRMDRLDRIVEFFERFVTHPEPVPAVAGAVAGAAGAAPRADEGEAGEAETRVAIAAASRAFSDAYVAKNHAAVAALYHPDAVILPPGRALHGRERIERYFTQPPGRGQLAHAMTSEELRIEGDMAADLGVWTNRWRTVEGEEHESSGNYLVVWQRDAAGEWKILYDMWDRPPPAENAP